MHSPHALLCLTALSLGLATTQCGPPVATQPAPTPVYAEELTVPPLEILHGSLEERPQDEATGEQPKRAPDDGRLEDASEPARAAPAKDDPPESGSSEPGGAAQEAPDPPASQP